MQYVFILGHMRSRSSLLAHLLGSHPEICGYTESHIKYRNRWDLARLRWHIANVTRAWPRGRYLLDKQLHSRMYLPASLRNSPKLKTVILVREPIDTIDSIIRMGLKAGNRRDADPQQAAAYYCERLALLSSLAIELRDRALLVESDFLANAPELALAAISQHLQLTTPLRANYQRQRKTGEAGFGDMSSLIHLGEIVSARRREPVKTLPSSVLRETERSHAHFIENATAWAPSVGFNFGNAQPRSR